MIGSFESARDRCLLLRCRQRQFPAANLTDFEYVVAVATFARSTWPNLPNLATANGANLGARLVFSEPFFVSFVHEDISGKISATCCTCGKISGTADSLSSATL